MAGSGDVQLTGGAALVRMTASLGIRHAYGLASGKLGPVFRALGEEPGMDYVGVRHEAAAAFMATAIAAQNGSICLCLGETGPGGLNLLSALGGAFANNLPVLAVTSSNARSLTAPDLGAFSSSDNQRLFAALTKWSQTAADARRVPALVRDAVRIACSGRPGPVHLNIPADVLSDVATFSARDLDGSDWDPDVARDIPAPADRVARTAAMLRSAARPLVVAGGGLVRSGDSSAFRTLIERIGCPVVTTQMGLGLLASDDPHLVGQGGIIGGPAVLEALREADVILAIGCRFSSWMWADGPFGWKAATDQRLIQVDIDAAMIGHVRPVALGIACDAGHFVAQLAAEFASDRHASSEWLQRLAAGKAAHHERVDALADSAGTGGAMHPAALAKAVGEAIGTGGIAIFDGGHTTFWSNDFTPTAAPRTRFHEPGMTHLGFGLPWAIAMKRAQPDTEVWCITGDGAFGFTLQELDTARREGTPVIVVIHNNAAFGVIGFSQQRGGFEMGTDLSDTDYAAIARGFGCFGEVVRTTEEFVAALGRARASGLPAVIDARVSFHPHPMMPAFGRSTAAA